MFRPLPYILGVAALFVVACSSTQERKAGRTVEQVYTEAMENYEGDHWEDALAQFDVIKLQFPTSQYADDAQYHIAEINRRRGEFVLAAFNFSLVRRSFPTSEWAKESTFKIAQCYEEMILPVDRDQEYTIKAIQSYTDFQSVYPTDSLAMVSAQKVRELRGRLAERYIVIAEHYLATHSKKAALVYYDLVIGEYPDTEHYEAAVVGKVRVNYELARIEDCRAAIALYRSTVPEPRMKDVVDEFERTLP
jgi:outer membrane protein assembly factor BamD